MTSYSAVFITSQPDGTFELICRTIDENGDPLGTEWTDNPAMAARELAWWGCTGHDLNDCLRRVFVDRPIPEGRKSYDGTDIFLDGELI